MQLPKSVRTLAWAALILLVSEGLVRVRAWYRHGSAAPVADIYQLDDQGRRQLRPGARIEGSDRRVTINVLGFRGPLPLVPKPPDCLRIVALGDSTTFGLEAADDESVWVSRIGTHLAGATNRKIECINAAVPSYRLADSARLLEKRIASLDPDVIVINHIATDIAAHARRQFGAAAVQPAGATPIGAFFETHSLLFNLVRANSAGLNARWLSPRRHDSLDQRGIDEFEMRLRALVAACDNRGHKVVLCTTPRSFGDPAAQGDQYQLAASTLAHNPALSLRGLNDAFDRYNAAIRKVAALTNCTLVDLDRTVPKRADYFVDAIHLNDAGHDLVGTIVATQLSGLLNTGRLAQTVP